MDIHIRSIEETVPFDVQSMSGATLHLTSTTNYLNRKAFLQFTILHIFFKINMVKMGKNLEF